VADSKPDRRTSDTEHRDGEHNEARIFCRRHHVYAIDDQVSSGSKDEDHKNDVRPVFQRELFDS